MHSFGLRPEIKVPSFTPGPNAYDTDKSEDYLEGGISHTMGERLRDLALFSTPSPFAYRPEDCKDASPAASLHIKPKDPKKFNTPAPGAYNPENADNEVKESAAKYSFGIKSNLKKLSNSPAPNAYALAMPKDSPAYSLASRAKEIKKFNTPAPGSYEVKTEETVERKPAFDFGMKHSPYIYMGKMKGDTFISSRTEANGTTSTSNGTTSGFRQRSNTFTRDEPTVLRQTAVA